MSSLTAPLLKWYDTEKISMPWRGDPDPYHIWLSEVMLQQTQIETVIPYYYRWLENLPSIETTANASEDFILKLWEGLGYYARARNFHDACKTLVSNGDYQVPNTLAEFKQLKGVGDYIGAAVQSIAFNHPIPVIDSNVKRLLSRVLELNGLPDQFKGKMQSYLLSQISDIRPGDFNQAMMDLARLICKPRNPNCPICPVNQYCGAYANNTVNDYPIKKIKKPKPHYDIAVGVIWKGNNLLISKRKSAGLLGGLWEFPGGKIQHNESSEDCVIREIKEELNITVAVVEYISTIQHAYTHFSITMTGYHCRYLDGEPKAIGCADWKWLNAKDLDTLPFPKANHKLFENIPGLNPFND
jgi:A/G-specific adenine glycosylase